VTQNRAPSVFFPLRSTHVTDLGNTNDQTDNLGGQCNRKVMKIDALILARPRPARRVVVRD